MSLKAVFFLGLLPVIFGANASDREVPQQNYNFYEIKDSDLHLEDPLHLILLEMSPFEFKVLSESI